MKEITESTTFTVLHNTCKEQRHVSEIRNLLKGKYKLDMWLSGTSANSATIKIMVRPERKNSVEVTNIEPRFVNYLLEIAKRSGKDLVKSAYLESKKDMNKMCRQFIEMHPSQEAHVNELISEYKLEL